MPEETTKPTLEKIWIKNNEGEDDHDEVDDVLPKLSEKRRPLAPPPSAVSQPTTFGNRPRHNTRVDAPPISTPGRGFLSPQHSVHEKIPSEEELSNAFTRELQEGMKRLVDNNRDESSIDSVDEEVTRRVGSAQGAEKKVGAV